MDVSLVSWDVWAFSTEAMLCYSLERLALTRQLVVPQVMVDSRMNMLDLVSGLNIPLGIVLGMILLEVIPCTFRVIIRINWFESGVLVLCPLSMIV